MQILIIIKLIFMKYIRLRLRYKLFIIQTIIFILNEKGRCDMIKFVHII